MKKTQIQKDLMLFAFLVIIQVFISASIAQNATFQGLGDLPGGSFMSQAQAISDDGSVVVGFGTPSSNFQGFRWTSAGGMTGLESSAGGLLPCSAGISGNGDVIVGSGLRNQTVQEAYRWTNGQTVGLGDLPGGMFFSDASAVSYDGSIIAGVSISSLGTEAFRWTSQGGMVGLGLFGPAAMSHDGSVIVGTRNSGSVTEAVRWTQAGGIIGLGDFPGGNNESQAFGISADGSIVVGYSWSDFGKEAFIWTQEQGLIRLGYLPGGPGGGFDSTIAEGVSDDGSVIVGLSNSKAFYYTRSGGMQNLQDLLINNYGLNLTGWKLTDAAAVSADGLTIAGSGINPYGNTEAWIATIPEPCTLLLLGIGSMILRKHKV